MVLPRAVRRRRSAVAGPGGFSSLSWILSQGMMMTTGFDDDDDNDDNDDDNDDNDDDNDDD